MTDKWTEKDLILSEKLSALSGLLFDLSQQVGLAVITTSSHRSQGWFPVDGSVGSEPLFVGMVIDRLAVEIKAVDLESDDVPRQLCDL